MKKLLPFLSLLLFVSCKQDQSSSSTESGSEADLKNKISQLELDNSMKDSIINESLSYFNEIKENLEAISVKKDEIRVKSDNPEISQDDKAWILEQIRHINFLREENARKVKQLNSELKKNGLKIKELEVMIESLLSDIKWKDEQIVLLQGELERLDQEYSALFDAYQEQSLQIDVLTDEIHKAFYAYGSEEELTDNKVIEKKNGFLGLGKKAELKSDFNDKYFTSIDITKTKSIMIEGKDIGFVTAHPSKSYRLEESGNRTKIVITNASEFWKVSKYLVVTIE